MTNVFQMNHFSSGMSPALKPTGPQGPTGPTGAQGAKGEQGIPGIQGIPGVANGINAAIGILVNPDGTHQYESHHGSTVIHQSPGIYNVNLPTDIFLGWAQCTVSVYNSNTNPPNGSCKIAGMALVRNGITIKPKWVFNVSIHLLTWQIATLI